jgi:hypothetical protein
MSIRFPLTSRLDKLAAILRTPEDGKFPKSTIPERHAVFLCSHSSSVAGIATSEYYQSFSVSEMLLSFNICKYK